MARGFARAVEESGYVVLAFAILWDHVHAVVERYPGRTIEKIIGHLKTRATQQLTAEGLNPMARFADESGRCPSVWVQHGWNVFLNEDDEIERSIDYDNRNPSKMGLSPQQWSFVRRRAV